MWAINVAAEDFREFENVATGYESYRFKKLRVTVMPLANVAMNPGNWSDKANAITVAPAYALFPWHRDVPASGGAVSFSDALSIDKHRIFRGTQIGSQSYNLNTITTAKDNDGNRAVSINWSPRIAVQGEYNKIRHYGGMLAIQGIEGVGASNTMKFNVKMDLYCTFYGQNIIPLPKA